MKKLILFVEKLLLIQNQNNKNKFDGIKKILRKIYELNEKKKFLENGFYLFDNFVVKEYLTYISPARK